MPEQIVPAKSMNCMKKNKVESDSLLLNWRIWIKACAMYKE